MKMKEFIKQPIDLILHDLLLTDWNINGINYGITLAAVITEMKLQIENSDQEYIEACHKEIKELKRRLKVCKDVIDAYREQRR